MNAFRVFFFGWMALGIISQISGTASAAPGDKYAYVDVAKIFDEYQKTKENDRILQQTGKKKEQERDALVNEIRQLKDEFVLLSDEAKAKKQETLDAKVRQLQDFDKNTRRDLGEERSKAVREIFKDIDDTVQRYGERQGYDLIFNDRALLYRSSKYDVTTDVLNELNKDYSKKKK